MWRLLMWIAVFIGFSAAVASQGYYSLIAPGYIKSNRKYTVLLSLHQSPEPVKINIYIEGPTYQMEDNVFLKPFESKAITFRPPKLTAGQHRLIVEGASGLKFYNESELIAFPDAGPKIYIQTDKAVYKPGDEVQFRIVLLDEHTRPLQISEPIRVEVMDSDDNRVKQFKDITIIKGVYKNKFQLSPHPVMGSWAINVYLSGRYDFLVSKSIRVQKYLLPKFSVYIETKTDILLTDPLTLKALIYGQYTFDKYVEGQIKTQLVQVPTDVVLDEKEFQIKDLLNIEFNLNVTDMLRQAWGVRLNVELTEKFTGQKRNHSQFIDFHDEPYLIYVPSRSIHFAKGKPYQLTVMVKNWDHSAVQDSVTPVTMQHGERNYSAYLDTMGEAIFQFEHDPNSDHIIRYGNATYKMSNILPYEPYKGNKTEPDLSLALLGEKPVRINVTSTKDMPYLKYTIVAHANIIQTQHIDLPTKPRSHIIEITPSIEMVPYTFVYVHYIDEGNYRYSEIVLNFPLEFENKVSITAPKKVKPGEKVTLELKAQPKSLVGVLAVDLGVYLLDPSYELKKYHILDSLRSDITRIPMLALVYPGLLSGVITMTNAHYEFVPLFFSTDQSPTDSSVLRFRKNFPETWIFENYEITNDTTHLTLNIPDTVTTWRVTAFSVNEKTGFGIVDEPTHITTVQAFFITLSLPYAVKRGEIVAIPILVHNYHEQSLDTEVSLFNDKEEFYFMESTIFNKDVGSEDNRRSKNLTLGANSVGTVVFLINPRQVGEISLQVTATNPLSSDGIIEKLRVEPEGIRIDVNHAVFTSVVPNEPIEMTIPLNISGDKVPHSEFITLSVVGDNMAPVLLNLNDLLSLPTGCGEQNMANFAPNVIVLQYLRSMGQYHKERDLVAKARRYIEIGFQQQLTYRHRNGGYSVFGQRKDREASTWLTAYTIRFFIKSLRYTMAMESHIIESGLDYLAKAQHEDGSFPYTGYLIYPAQQNRFGFTAFVLMAFLEDQKFARNYSTTIDNGLAFLNDHLDQINDVYALSIMAVTLQMAKQKSNSKKILDKLLQQKQRDNSSIWWSQNDRNRAKDVEITGYVLLALVEDGNNEEACKKAFKWLNQQRNKKGGFKSSQDTVVGLQALIKYSMKYKITGDIDILISYTAMGGEMQEVESGEIAVDENNVKVLQSEELPQTTRAVEIQVTGLGASLIQLTYEYYIIAVETFQYFRIEPKVELPNPGEMSLDVCFSYIEPNATATNIVVMEINLPSGFSVNEEDSDFLLDNEIVQRIEMNKSATNIVVYSEKLQPNVRNCLNIMAYKMYDVVHRKPASIIIYDYYDFYRYDTAFYDIYNEMPQDGGGTGPGVRGL